MKRAFKRILTHPQPPIIGRERAISSMAIEFDNHCKKRKILPECGLKWTTEEAQLPLRKNLTTLPTTSTELYDTFFCSFPGHVIPFCNHHIKAVIREGTLVLPGSPLGTYSRRPPALQPPLTRMRMPSSTMTNPTALPQLTELVRCPGVTPGRKCR
jgi:hypothetical protein